MRQNMRMRKPLIATIAAVCALALAATGTDFGFAIFAEYRLSRTLRTEANLNPPIRRWPFWCFRSFRRP